MDECIDAYLNFSKDVFKVYQVLAEQILVEDDHCRFDYRLSKMLSKN